MVNGKPTGAVRVSFGYMSTYEDAKVDFSILNQFFNKKLSHALHSLHLLEECFFGISTNGLLIADVGTVINHKFFL